MDSNWFRILEEGLTSSVEDHIDSYFHSLRETTLEIWPRIKKLLVYEFENYSEYVIQHFKNLHEGKQITDQDLEYCEKTMSRLGWVIRDMTFEVEGGLGKLVLNDDEWAHKLLEYGSSTIPAFHLRQKVFTKLRERLSIEGFEITKDFLTS